MVEDALGGMIDLIVAKSVSRFARNTVDSLVTVRKLKEHGTEIYFEKKAPIQQKSRHYGAFGTITKPLVFSWCLNLCDETSWYCTRVDKFQLMN
jgi:hypothetical protein